MTLMPAKSGLTDGIEQPTVQVAVQANSAELQLIDRLNRDAELRWGGRLLVQNALTRSLVSFQANKSRSVYRWYKFKEAFSADLVEYLLARYGITNGAILDPFAGSGTALFVACAMGMRAEGIELLPIGQTIIATKQLVDGELQSTDIERLAYWGQTHPWSQTEVPDVINGLRITRGAYPVETVAAMGRFLAASRQENERVHAVLLFGLLYVLESVSYTRKDGQYLRWDDRSGRRQGKKAFDKGEIPSFETAISNKLQQIVADLCEMENPETLFAVPARARGDIVLHRGSCLDELPRFEANSYDAIVTSPPYCNRYDYTRTYALELALLGVDESGLVGLRQSMLSCTVENRSKDLMATNPQWAKAIAAADSQQLLQTVLGYLDSCKTLGVLNNDGIPRMVRGYFYELACVIAECARVLKPGAPLIMVNDNVRYAGATIHVDIILSEIAERLGFAADEILVLPGGKGNSSQQMGLHGREALRKCVYVWRKR
jgi:DNA modification methylase